MKTLFPSVAEIQDLFQNYRNSPAFQAELEKLIVFCLNSNAEKMRTAAKAGHNFLDFDEPMDLTRQLRELEYPEPDFYRLLEKRLRDIGYMTHLSVHNEYDNNVFCELMISW